MDYSSVLRFRWNCEDCGASADDETYMAVDADARPDLVEKVIAGEIPAVTCPACAKRTRRGVPLLVYGSRSVPQLFFFCPPDSSATADEANRKTYVDALLDRLGPVSAEEAEEFGSVCLPFDAASVFLRSYVSDDLPADESGSFLAKSGDGPPPARVLEVLARIAATWPPGLGRSVTHGPLVDELVRLAEQGLDLLGDGDAHPDLRATLRMCLGQVLCAMRREGDVIDVERGIGLLLRAARGLTDDEDSTARAVAHLEVGRAYGRRAIGDFRANQEYATRHLRTALEAVTPETSEQTWARARTELAIVLIERGSQSGPEEVEEAIGLLVPVVERLDPAAAPYLWCDAQSLLAGAYNVRQQGDPAVNQEQVIRLYERLNEVESEETDPEQWANTQARLAVSLCKRTRGDRRDNHLRAREHALRALRIYERVGDRTEASSTRDKLALIAHALGEYDEEVRLHRAALADRPKDSTPQLWARSTTKLGVALLRQAERGATGDPVATARRGLRHVREAVDAYEGLPTRVELALAHGQVADAARRCRALDPTREPELRALELSALEAAVDRAHDRPEVLREVATGLGNALAERDDWTRASAAYGQAVAADDELFRSCLVSASRERHLRAAGDLHQRAAYALARAGRLRDAVLCLERGRTRTFHLALSPDRAQLKEVSWTAPEAHAAYVRAAEAVQALESRNRELGRPRSAAGDGRQVEAAEYEVGELLGEARAALAAAVARIQELPGMETFLRDTTWADVRAAARPGEPLCCVACAPAGSVSLLVRHGSDAGPGLEAVWSPLTAGEATGLARAVARAARADGRGLRPLLARLGSRLVAPLAAALGPAAAGATVVACGPLAHLPLHAATLPATGEPLLATHSVAYAPSVRLLRAARRRAGAAPSVPVLVAASASGADSGLLAAPEAAALTRLFAAVGEGHHVTRDLLTGLARATHVHLACHGAYDPGDPLASGLDLDGGRVTLADLLDARPRPLERARLVTLSACESGLVDARLPDEAIGLPTGIMLAGGAGVVCTQWEARDSAAVLLMLACYRRLLGLDAEPGPGTAPPPGPPTPARALRAAQLWLRSAPLSALLALDWLPEGVRRRLSSDGVPERPFAHPYLWAPFALVGT
ncbi:CHAT domain-containing protein [Streptomyces sp. AN091965]|uniref:CHAT domain-containing protein n=1 Tax=Streptomyces sp. AN091965 TaxID=2927803 RepID=UPI001F610EBA|nr:CHAT domain-containing protein [Streptomyces sp. AN091965]MCI3934458.1 CHAT domain-containing protein [Streptomyces sp. AN091965]